MEESNHYYPFGGLFGESCLNTDPYKYNGKELDRMHGLNWYDYSARPYDPMGGGGFPTMDPLCEKYYSISTYVYCLNNPIKYIDPDGRDIVIFYGDKLEKFVYNGTNQNTAPNNRFVKSVIQAYNYDVKNGGGQNLMKIATTQRLKVGVQETNLGSESVGDRNLVLFNPQGGLRLDDGNVLSPATLLEHEFAHVVDRKEGKVDLTPDPNYTHASEKRIYKRSRTYNSKSQW